jgi:hypothetical protein
MIRFSFEVPIPHLYDFLPYQDFIFTLQHLYAIPEYLEFLQAIQSDQDIWIDNSYNEKMEATSIKQLISAYDMLDPNSVKKVIAPDNPKWDVTRIQMEAEDLGHQIGMDKVLLVANSHEMMETLSQNLEIDDPSRFAIAYRQRMLLSISELKYFHGTHFLGLVDLNELIRIQPASCDTSMPIKLAIRGRTIKDWMLLGCPHIHTKDLGEAGLSFFNHKMSIEELELAYDNIIYLRNYIRGKVK